MRKLLFTIFLVLIAVGCARSLANLDVPEPQDPGVRIQSPPAPPPVMTCVQPDGGCVPEGYRGADCETTGLKNGTTVAICVQAVPCAVYMSASTATESCFSPNQKVDNNGSARGFFAVLPDASYTFVTRSVSKSGAFGEALATTSATIVASIGDRDRLPDGGPDPDGSAGTQCGGFPYACPP